MKAYFQDYPELSYRKMLKHSATRWLSLKPCLQRLIDFYEPLIKYFNDCIEADKPGKAQTIRNRLNQPETRPILLFLLDAIGSVDRYNLFFQVGVEEVVIRNSTACLIGINSCALLSHYSRVSVSSFIKLMRRLSHSSKISSVGY